ncbi:MAG: stage V sporulation protein AD [Ruminococcaceae bacterium]|nr:stage V sporulation protein AD [Oscillospiraceae bacterium]
MQKIIDLGKRVRLLEAASAVGHEEFFGPLGDLFDYHDESDKFGAKTWELSEGELDRITLNLLLKKAGLKPCDIDILFAGDLQNQCVASSQGLSSFGIPYIGLYGACSTSAEGLLCASMFLNSSKSLKRCASITSSHNCAAERQFRTPIEYGGQRTPTAQWTATAAGAFILERSDTEGTEKDTKSLKRNIYVREVMAGKIVDSGVSDAANMGAAMAPAAADTIESYFKKSESSPSDFDFIITGDLGKEGGEILRELLLSIGIDIRKNHSDCGVMMYDFKRQDVHSGASGCGCSASVLASYFIPRLKKGEIKNILFMATGALMSPSSIQQGGSIAGIAPLIHLTSE